MIHEVEFIIKSNESLAENKIKNEIEQLLLNIRMETIFMNTENCKTNESHEFVLNLSQRLDLTSLNKHVTYQNLSICYAWKNMRKQYKNNKFKIIVPTWNDEFQLQDGSYSVSDIVDYIQFIIKKYKTLTTIPPIYVYINRINNRLVFKIKDEYKLEVQMPETMKLFGSTKKITQNKKWWKNTKSWSSWGSFIPM